MKRCKVRYYIKGFNILELALSPFHYNRAEYKQMSRAMIGNDLTTTSLARPYTNNFLFHTKTHAILLPIFSFSSE